MPCFVTLSQKELQRLEAVQKIRERRLTVTHAAELLHLSRSQVHRLLQAYDRDGVDGLVSRKRGRPSNRRHTDDFRNLALDLTCMSSIMRWRSGVIDSSIAGRSARKCAAASSCNLGCQNIREWWRDQFRSNASKPPTPVGSANSRGAG